MAKKDETTPAEAAAANLPDADDTQVKRVKVTNGDKTLLVRPHLVPRYEARGYETK